MTEKFTFETSYMTYFNNQPYIYPTDEKSEISTDHSQNVNTGWHVLPLMLWRHWATPRAWADFQIKYQAYTVLGYEVTVFNPIPLTTQISLQGTTGFTAFNSTHYSLMYQDDYYETPWFNWLAHDNLKYNHNLAFKEGLCTYQNTNKYRYELPIYSWRYPHWRTSTSNTMSNSSAYSGDAVWPTTGKPAGIFWDPMNEPGKLKELRPGKNACTFTWSVHDSDKNKWFNLDNVMQWAPYTAPGPYNCKQRPFTGVLVPEDDPDQLSTLEQTNPKQHDFTWADWADQPIVPNNWAWFEMRASIVQNMTSTVLKPDLWFPGTEAQTYKYPPTQVFIKGIPIFTDQNALINIATQCSVTQKLFLECKPRKSAIYAPTWGPWTWKQLYSHCTWDTRFVDSMVRGKTAGMRKTWQNTIFAESHATGSLKGHWREDPYNYTTSGLVTTGAGTGADGTFLTTMAGPKKPQLIVTFSKEQERVVIDKAQKAMKHYRSAQSLHDSPEEMEHL